jgi:hypothetical protein
MRKSRRLRLTPLVFGTGAIADHAKPVTCRGLRGFNGSLRMRLWHNADTT